MALKIHPFTCGIATAVSEFLDSFLNVYLYAERIDVPADPHILPAYQPARWHIVEENTYWNRTASLSFKNPDAFWLFPAAKWTPR